MDTFKFDNKQLKNYQMKALSIATPLLILMLLLVTADLLPSFSLLLLLVVLCLFVALPFFYTLYKKTNRINNQVVLGLKTINVVNPVTNYKFTRSFGEIKTVKQRTLLGMPIIKVGFSNNEKVRFVGMESSESLFSKLTQKQS